MSAFVRLCGARVAFLALLLVMAAVGARAAVPTDFTVTTTLGSQYHFRQLYCSNHAVRMWFYTVQKGTFALPGAASFDFAADPTAFGAARIMAGFTAVDGTTYTAAQGFDPCAHTTCLGVQCANTSEILVQDYVDPTLYLFGSTADSLEYYNYGEGSTLISPRCGCWDPNFSREVPRQSYTAYNVDPTGPSCEQSDAVCGGMVCDPNPNTNALYYMSSTDGTVGGCKCCIKQLSRIVTKDIEDSTYAPVCTTVQPSTTVRPTHPGSSSSGSGSGGVTVEPALPPSNFFEFVSNSCPADTLSGIAPGVIDANADQFCCYFSSAYNETDTRYACGDELLTLRGAGTLNCISTIPSAEFTCCASLAYNGATTTTGYVCKDSSRSEVPSAARGMASSLVAILIALVTPLLLSL